MKIKFVLKINSIMMHYNMLKVSGVVILMLCSIIQTKAQKIPSELTFATYNVSMEAENYVKRGAPEESSQILIDQLASGTNQQIKNIARIIQTVRPDVILLNEFDYIEDPKQGVQQFIKGYLNKDQEGTKAIDYPYFYYSTVNTGQPSPYDLDNNGIAGKFGSDAWGFGMYPGHYGMMLLSRYPIDTKNVRTFQHFKWKDMPGFLKTIKADGSDWYQPEAWALFPLSSKSHWDVPVKVGKKTIHVLASHPTPPAFDGAEKRNKIRNHDEIRFWTDYISGSNNDYIYDDKGVHGGIADNSSFVIMGDQNASPDEGSGIADGIRSLLASPKVQGEDAPSSKGGQEYSPNNPFAKNHTAFFRLRADYVLPSRSGLKVVNKGIFWPAKGEPMYDLVEKRESSSDHRMVWLKVKIE